MQITFLPQNLQIEANKNESVLEVAIKSSIYIDSNCGGKGSCGKCKVRVISGTCSRRNHEEERVLTELELEKGYRLACKLYAQSDITVALDIVEEDKVRKSIRTNFPQDFILSPTFMIEEQMEKREIPVTAYGVAFDIGTTSIVGMLWNLKTGEYKGAKTHGNPQRAYGADVISRIQYGIKSEENLLELQQKVLLCCSNIIKDLAIDEKIVEQDIYDITVVGNSTMSHLFLGISPGGLSKAPFIGGFAGRVTRKANEFFKEVNEKAKVRLLPNLAGHVGSDITAGILATNLYKEKKLKILIDIGTNGEIVLVKDNQLFVCSTAAGPAFEGAQIKYGMRARTGAIEGVKIEKDLLLDVIGGVKPIGICGSGLIDAVAELIRVGIIDETGFILDKETLIKNKVSEELVKRVIETDRGNNFILGFLEEGFSLLLTQSDIREVQLAKAAIYAGIMTMLRSVDESIEGISELIIAGAFGNYIKRENALRIGLLPHLPYEKIIFLGNTAGVGASMVLLSSQSLDNIDSFVNTVKHVELANDDNFMEEYLQAMNFPVE